MIRVASAPVSYGVFELTVDGRELPAPAVLAGTMHELGYIGTELGPPGYFGRGAALAGLLGERELLLVGSFLPLRFSRDDGFAEDLRSLEDSLDLVEGATTGQAEKPTILLSDAFSEPDRLRFAGAIEAHPETWLPAARQATLVANVHRAAERCRERGFPVSFHYHAGTYVETPREIDAFVAALDPSLMGLCLDTGHSAFGGGDGLDVLRDYGALVNHVHLKDVDRPLLERLHARGEGLETAWEVGVFCALGAGDANVAGCLEALEEQAYDGWVVVEQDRVLGPDRTFAQAVEDQRRNRAWLAARGI